MIQNCVFEKQQFPNFSDIHCVYLIIISRKIPGLEILTKRREKKKEREKICEKSGDHVNDTIMFNNIVEKMPVVSLNTSTVWHHVINRHCVIKYNEGKRVHYNEKTWHNKYHSVAMELL